MKNKFAIINVSLMVVVLCSMLFQSVHSYEHLLAQLSKPECHENHGFSGAQITHEHQGFEHCFACEFTFSHFISSNLSVYKSLIKTILFKNNFFLLNKINKFYNGISYSLRGPPSFKI